MGCFRISCLVAPATFATIFTHDELGRIESRQSDELHFEKYFYDASGNRTQFIQMNPITLGSIDENRVFTNHTQYRFGLQHPGRSRTNIRLRARFSNPALIRTHLFLNGMDRNSAFLSLTASPGKSGTSRLTIIADDGIIAAARTISLTVVASAEFDDASPPTISAAQPVSDSLISSNRVTISGIVTDTESGVAAITIGELPVSNLSTDETGTIRWQTTVDLGPGRNVFEIHAVDGSVRANKATLRLDYFHVPPEASLLQALSFQNGGLSAEIVSASGSDLNLITSTNLIDWTNWLAGFPVQGRISLPFDLAEPKRFFATRTAPSDIPKVLLKRRDFLLAPFPFALGDNGLLYASLRNGVFAFDSNLNPRWEHPMRSAFCGLSFPSDPVSISAEDVVFAGGDQGNCGTGVMVAFNGLTGVTERDIDVNHSRYFRQVPAIDDSTRTVYFGTAPLTAAITKSWEISGREPVGLYIGDRGLAVDAVGNVYVGSHGGNGDPRTIVRSFTPSGEHRWSRTNEGFEGPYIVAIPNADILLLTGQTMLHAWRLSDGESAWTIPDLDNPVVSPDGKLICNAKSRPDIVALNLSGSVISRTTVGESGSFAVDFVDSHGNAYARFADELIAIDPMLGVSWRWKAETTLSAPTRLTSDGRIVIHDSESTIYVLDTALRYAASYWPVARTGNRRHTGKANDVLSVPTR